MGFKNRCCLVLRIRHREPDLASSRAANGRQGRTCGELIHETHCRKRSGRTAWGAIRSVEYWVATMRYRASKVPYIGFSIIFGGVAAAATYREITSGGGFWQAAVMMGCAWIFAIVWLAGYEIRFDEKELSFRDLFSGTHRIKLEDIKKIRLASNWDNGGKAPLRLVVEPIPHSGLRRFSINAKVFSDEAVRSVLNLGSRVASADDGGLIDGIAVKHYRAWRASKRKRSSEQG